MGNDWYKYNKKEKGLPFSYVSSLQEPIKIGLKNQRLSCVLILTVTSSAELVNRKLKSSSFMSRKVLAFTFPPPASEHGRGDGALRLHFYNGHDEETSEDRDDQPSVWQTRWDLKKPHRRKSKIDSIRHKLTSSATSCNVTQKELLRIWLVIQNFYAFACFLMFTERRIPALWVGALGVLCLTQAILNVSLRLACKLSKRCAKHDNQSVSP